ncbi:MAG: serine hydrolase [Sediminibacterium sp.]|nr:serine hydrolase [Sediminibacterium sp.]
MRKYILLLLFPCASYIHAQKIDYQTIDSVLQSHAVNDQFSAVVLIAEKGKIKYEKAFGYRDLTSKTLLQTTDIFELASVSKQFTAMVIMILKEKKLLQYDDLIEKYLDIPYKGITIRHLLTHTSGLPNYMNVMSQYWDKTKVAGNAEILSYLNQYKPPKLAEPGEKYEYSNTGYVMLASIAEKITGKDFASLCMENIFQPLQMTHTAIRNKEEKDKVENFATGYIYNTSTSRYERADAFPSSNYVYWLGNRRGPGNISSTAEDLLLWDKALYTSQLVAKSTLEEAFQPMHLLNGKMANYGFGWLLIPNSRVGKIVWHNGDNPGFQTAIVRYIDQKNTLIILCNSASDKSLDTIKEIERIIIKQ